MRETQTFRVQLELINSRYPNKDHLSIREVAAYDGVSENTAKKRYPFIKRTPNHTGGCSKVQLAKAKEEKLC